MKITKTLYFKVASVLLLALLQSQLIAKIDVKCPETPATTKLQDCPVIPTSPSNDVNTIKEFKDYYCKTQEAFNCRKKILNTLKKDIKKERTKFARTIKKRIGKKASNLKMELSEEIYKWQKINNTQRAF